LVEKKVPHLGHLTMVSFDMVSFDTDAHPKEKQMTIDNIMNIFIFAFIRPPIDYQRKIYCHLKIMSSNSSGRRLQKTICGLHLLIFRRGMLQESRISDRNHQAR
jgi:hypothetical protein